jgi:hypothetical protein
MKMDFEYVSPEMQVVYVQISRGLMTVSAVYGTEGAAGADPEETNYGSF